jgi:L-alanine-DL-glutamate epimerase-like enolase superfamily enzyme
MRIRSVETFSVGLPFKDRYVTATGSLDRREMAVLRLTGDDGVVGHGDAVPLSLRGGPSLAAVVAELEGPCARVLLGTPLGGESPSDALRECLRSCVASGAGQQALAAVDAALLDLLGRASGLPAWRLLDAQEAGPVACNGTIGADSPDEAARSSAELAGAGFGSIKVKVGTEGDLERMRAVREACGAGVALRIDANGAWGLERAAAALAELAEVGLELAEQPCPDLEQCAELRGRTDVPLVLDESVATEADAERAVAVEACDAVTVKLAKVGGPHAAIRVASRAPAYLSSALDSPLGIAAAVHTAQALPGRGFAAGLAHGLATSGLFSDNIAEDGALRGPSIQPPAGPGLGVEIDDDALRRLSLR